MPEKAHAVFISLGLAMGAGLGTTFGAVIGAVTGDVGMWVALGVPIGAGVGLAIGTTLVALNQPKVKGICEKCGHSTKGLRSRVCPECGAELSVSKTGE